MAKTKKTKVVEEPASAKAQEILFKTLNKAYGAGSVFNFRSAPLDVPKLPSGSIGLDNALGGGYPLGRIIEIYGPASSGKTTIMLLAIKMAQKLARDPKHVYHGRVPFFIDAEQALDPTYAKKLGVDMNDMMISQPKCGEDALNIAKVVIESGQASIVVVDSVAALTPRAELQGDIGDHSVGTQSRLMSQAMRMLISACHQTSSLLLFTNQLRMKIGVMFGNQLLA